MLEDYVLHFDAVTRLHVRMRRSTNSALRLMRSFHQYANGYYADALQCAQDVQSPEADYQEGLCWIAIARLRAGAIVGGPGAPDVPNVTVGRALTNAATCFKAAGDVDAQAWLEALEPLRGLDEERLRTPVLELRDLPGI